MDQETLRRVQHVLQGLIQSGVARVGFLLNQNGRLVAHVGQTPTFHPQARFADLKDDDDDGENVYMTGLEDIYIIGVVFAEPITMEAVRDAVEAARPQLMRVLSPYLRSST